MITLIAGGMLFLCSAYIGIGIRRHYRQRVAFYMEFSRFLEKLSDEIYFLKTPLVGIIDNFSEDKSGEFIKLLYKFKQCILNGESTATEIFKTQLVPNFLKQNEKLQVASFFSGLGKTDCQTQLNSIKNQKIRVDAVLAECKSDLNKGGNLAYKLGILLGIAIMIIVA